MIDRVCFVPTHVEVIKPLHISCVPSTELLVDLVKL